VPLERKVDPGVGQKRGQLAAAVKNRKPDVEITRLRHELAEARILAAAKAVAEALPSLSEDKRARIADLLTGGAQ
jgi:S-adenosylmethionine hydrolase